MAKGRGALPKVLLGVGVAVFALFLLMALLVAAAFAGIPKANCTAMLINVPNMLLLGAVGATFSRRAKIIGGTLFAVLAIIAAVLGATSHNQPVSPVPATETPTSVPASSQTPSPDASNSDVVPVGGLPKDQLEQNEAEANQNLAPLTPEQQQQFSEGGGPREWHDARPPSPSAQRSSYFQGLIGIKVVEAASTPPNQATLDSTLQAAEAFWGKKACGGKKPKIVWKALDASTEGLAYMGGQPCYMEMNSTLAKSQPYWRVCATFVHEYGHLLGHVAKSAKDSDGSYHSTNRNSIMYFEDIGQKPKQCDSPNAAQPTPTPASNADSGCKSDSSGGGGSVETVASLNGIKIPYPKTKLGDEQHLINGLKGGAAAHCHGPDANPLAEAVGGGSGAYAPYNTEEERWYFNEYWTDDRIGDMKLVVTSTQTKKQVVVSVQEKGPAGFVTSRDGIGSGAPPDVFHALGLTYGAAYTGNPNDKKNEVTVAFAKDQKGTPLGPVGKNVKGCDPVPK